MVGPVFDACPRGVGIAAVPTVLHYDRALEPVGSPVTGVSTPVDAGCWPGVESLLPGTGGASALMVGRRGPWEAATAALWIAGPAQ